MRTLIGHLAQFSVLSKQGELLCTQGLSYLLQDVDARRAFASHVLGKSGSAIVDAVTWRAEVTQQDGGRPDLEAVAADGRITVKIEAKLGAGFSDDQFQSYSEDLQRHREGGHLLVLVPRHRVKEADQAVRGALHLDGAAPWRLADRQDIVVCVILWDEVLSALAAVTSERFTGDLRQFQSMYRVLSGYDIEPLASHEELLAWREKEGMFVSLVDRVTRTLTLHGKVMPMYVMPLDQEPTELEPKGYRVRYVSRPLGDKNPWFCIGVRDFFAGHDTPVWLRFDSNIPSFSLIRDRLNSSPLAQVLVDTGKHVWIPLSVPIHRDGEQMVEALLSQVEDVIAVAFRPLT